MSLLVRFSPESLTSDRYDEVKRRLNEAGHWPEVCKKSMQAMAADMRGKIEPRFFETYSIEQLRGLSSRELEALGRLCDPLIARPGA